MAWQLLAAALPYAAQAAGQYINRPREEEFKPQTGYMKKYLSHLRGRQADREVYHMAMRPALRAIGGQSRKMQRQIGYQTERAGVSGSGIEAQQRLTAGQMTMGAMQEASEKATAAQMVESRRLGDTAADVTARIGAEEERASQAYKTAKSQWGRQMVSTGLQAAGALAGQGISQGIQNKESLAYATEHLGAEKVKSMTAAGVSPDDIRQIAQEQNKADLYWKGKLGEGTVNQYLSQKYLLDVEGAGDGADTDPSDGVPEEGSVVEQEVVTDTEVSQEEYEEFLKGLEKEKNAAEEEAARVKDEEELAAAKAAEATRVKEARARQAAFLKGDEEELVAEATRVKEARATQEALLRKDEDDLLQLDESRRARISDPAYFFREDDPRLEGLTKEETLAKLREQGSEEAKEESAAEDPGVQDVPLVEPARGYQTATMTNEEKIKQNQELEKEMGSEYKQKVDEGESYAQWYDRRKKYFIDWKKRTK